MDRSKKSKTKVLEINSSEQLPEKLRKLQKLIDEGKYIVSSQDLAQNILSKDKDFLPSKSQKKTNKFKTQEVKKDSDIEPLKSPFLDLIKS